MVKSLTAIAFVAVSILANDAHAATIKNTDQKSQSLVVTEAGSRRDVLLKADQTVDLCPKGCFVTFPNGDRFAIKASDTIEINGNRASFR